MERFWLWVGTFTESPDILYFPVIFTTAADVHIKVLCSPREVQGSTEVTLKEAGASEKLNSNKDLSFCWKLETMMNVYDENHDVF